ncbi:ATP-binding protein [Corallococcus terminator]|uniref:ATP-binding protein n=1 Tax=Corallococcus terminator TaxID=2316733 RepID=UPI001FC9B1D9|nr:ATP-binding protein [Corallococcus terminator]
MGAIHASATTEDLMRLADAIAVANEAHHGTLLAESQPGQGATFIVELPAS